MVLIGLGEEFDFQRSLQRSPEYMEGCTYLKAAGLHWLIPAWNEFCAGEARADEAKLALEKLALLLEKKNYYVVSVSTNRVISGVPWKRAFLSEQGRYVIPCGSTQRKQCSKGCEKVLPEMTDEDEERIRHAMEELREKRNLEEGAPGLGVCPECGAPLILNNIYANHYNENGYLEQWRLYTKWLQGTLNRNLLVLELGVEMWFPSVIRWPFEKMAYFNQKAYFCRVNEKLYQLTEELTGKGCGISQNAIDWLSKL